MSVPVHVIVADVDPLVAEGLARSLSSEPLLIARPFGGPLSEVLRCAAGLAPAVVLVNAALLHTSEPHQFDFGRSVAVLALGSEPDAEHALECLRLGCMGYLSRKDGLATLARAIHAVAGGQFWAPRAVLSTLVQEMSEARQRLPRLTARQREILGLIRSGSSNTAIAHALFISPETVRWHVRRLYAKIGAADRAAAVAFARQHGIVWSGGTTAIGGALPGSTVPVAKIHRRGAKTVVKNHIAESMLPV